jgi:hypothetical protein
MLPIMNTIIRWSGAFPLKKKHFLLSTVLIDGMNTELKDIGASLEIRARVRSRGYLRAQDGTESKVTIFGINCTTGRRMYGKSMMTAVRRGSLSPPRTVG